MKFKFEHILLFFIAVLFTAPFLILLGLSFSKSWQFPNILPQTFTSTNWVDLFSSNNSILSSFFVSICISLPVALLSTIMGFITSNFIAYNKHKKGLLLLSYFPYALSPVIFAVCIRYFFIKFNLVGNIFGVMGAQLIITFPYCIIFFISFFNEKIKQYNQLVNTLGGTSYYGFKKVIMPIAKPFIFVCLIQSFLISWFEYGLTSIIGYGKVQTLTISVFQFITEANIFQASLSCCLIIIPPFVLFWINKKYLLKKIS